MIPMTKGIGKDESKKHPGSTAVRKTVDARTRSDTGRIRRKKTKKSSKKEDHKAKGR
jgi:hypothetical protein